MFIAALFLLGASMWASTPHSVTTAWIAALFLASAVSAVLSQVACGDGIIDDSAGLLGVGVACAFGADWRVIMAYVLGTFLADLRAPALVGGIWGALYNAAHIAIDLAICGSVTYVLMPFMPDLLAVCIGICIYSIANVVTIAPGVLGWHGLTSRTEILGFWKIVPHPIIGIEFVLMGASATVVLMYAPTAALILLLGPVIRAYNSFQSSRELAVEKRRSGIDELTGIPNRRAFRELLASEFELAREGGTGIALIISDLDDFKQVNDTRGHAEGDLVLQRAATLLVDVATQANAGATAARYGGEEFAILIAGEQHHRVTEIAEQIRARAAEELAEWGCSLSLGVAFLETNEDIPSLITRSDEAMYTAKQLGKNRVIVHGDSTWRLAADLAESRQQIARLELGAAQAFVDDMLATYPAGSDATWRPRIAATASEVLLRAGRLDESMALASEALEHIPRQQLTMRADAASTRAELAILHGDAPGARAALEALNQVPDRVDPRYRRLAEILELRVDQLAGNYIELPLWVSSATIRTDLDLARALTSLSRAAVMNEHKTLVHAIADAVSDVSPTGAEMSLLIEECKALASAMTDANVAKLVEAHATWLANDRVVDAAITLACIAALEARAGETALGEQHLADAREIALGLGLVLVDRAQRRVTTPGQQPLSLVDTPDETVSAPATDDEIAS